MPGWNLTAKTATGITVPPDIVESLGAGRRSAMLVTINGHEHETSDAQRRTLGGAVTGAGRGDKGIGPGEPQQEAGHGIGSSPQRVGD